MANCECDVLVVGAGPTGLTLALLLAQRGLSVIIAEKESGLYPLPRAAHIDHQVVRIFQELGLAEPILASCRHSLRYDFLTASGEVLLRVDHAGQIGSGGWPVANMIHQPSIEQALRNAVDKAKTVELRDNWTFERLEEWGDDVEAMFTTLEGEKSIRARYLVGADGARSPVREALGIDNEDLGFDESWMVIDTIVKDQSRLPRANLQICNPERPTTCCLMGEGRHRWEFMIKPGENPDDLLDNEMVRRLLEPWDVEGAVELERKAVYRFNAVMASRWRAGRSFLAGDAAHRMPPFAGQGLCSGVRDAANLAWKLAAVLVDDVHDVLLDSYGPEREPNVRSIMNMAIMMGRTVCITDPAAAAARDERMLAARAAAQSTDRMPEYAQIETGCIMVGSPAAGGYFPQAVAESGARLDDVLGPGPWLLTRAELPVNAARGPLSTRSLADEVLAPFSAKLRSWFDKHDCQGVLVRPDRQIFGTGAPGDLMFAWQSKLAGHDAPTTAPQYHS